MAHKASRDEEAHLALMRVHELQKGDPNGPIRAVTLEQFKAHVVEMRQHHEGLNEHLLAGRLPWTLLGHALKRETYIDWAIRTQEMTPPDRAIARAEYCVYSTNGFSVRNDADNGRALAAVECVAAGTAVVADFSAAITLHRLGLLDKAIAYFGRTSSFRPGFPSGFLTSNDHFLPDKLRGQRPIELFSKR